MLALMAASPLAAQPAPVRVRTHVSADSVRIGERFTLSLIAEHNFQTDVIFPRADAGPAQFGDLEVVQRSSVQSRDLGSDQPGTRADSVAYTVTTFAIDSARVPPLSVRLVAEGDTMRAASAPRWIPVVSVAGPDAQGLRGLAPLVTFPQPIWPWVLLLLVALTAVAGAGYWWWLRQQPEPTPDPEPVPEPTRTPYQDAMARLETLRERDLKTSDAIKLYFVELSDILRTYLSRRLDVPAMEHTTSEVIDALRPHPNLSDAATERIRALLELADQVKFADMRPSPDDSRKARDAVRSVIGSIEATQRPPEDEKRKATSKAQRMRTVDGG